VGDERGRGLAIMRGLMDDVVVTPTTAGTAVVLRRRRGS
jgi:anti-sigma regulatory factor (Ser/Thr protein kinase)